jgi:hypothetical protein
MGNWCENSLGAGHFHGFGVALAGPWNTVEKVGIGPSDDHEPVKNVPKSTIPVPSRGSETGMEGFFNTLVPSRKLAGQNS